MAPGPMTSLADKRAGVTQNAGSRLGHPRWAGGGLTNKEQGEDEGELVDGVAQDVLHHGP